MHVMRPNRRSGLAPELGILLATVRGDPADLARSLATPARRGAEDGPSWPRLIALAERESATPFLRRQLAGLEGGPPVLGDPDVTAEAHETLGRLALVHEFRLRELDRRLDELLPAFHDEGIDALLLKGAALQRTVYRSVVERPMADVDVLVGAGQAQRAWEIAHALGWRRRTGAPPDAAYADHHHLAPMRDDAGLGLGLEIHTRLFPSPNPFLLSASAVRRAAQPLEGHPGVGVPSPEHALLHAAIHFAWSHAFGFGVWKTLRDVHALASTGTIDGDVLVRAARLARARACVYWTLRLAREWASVEVDAEILAALAPPGPEMLRRALARHFARRLAPRADEELPPALAHGMWELAMRPVSEGYAYLRPWSDTGKWVAGLPRESPNRVGNVKRSMGAMRHLARVITAR